MKQKVLLKMVAVLALAVFAQGLAFAQSGEKKNDFYIKASATTGYYFFGGSFASTIGQVEGIFNGDVINMQITSMNVNQQIISDKKVQRANTAVLPTGDICLGYTMGRHQFELAMGIAGMVKLNTIQVQNGATMRELPGGDPADLKSWPLSNIGLVSKTTHEGRYNLGVTMNEELWIWSPVLTYDFIIMEKPWGRLSAGGGAGVMFLSITQKIKFRMDRTDADPGVINQRSLESSVLSTAVGDFGPVVRLFAGYRKTVLKGIDVDVRLGASWGFVTLTRHVDGSGTVYMGNDTTLPISFPSSAMTAGGDQLANKAKTTMNLIGVFLQVGIVF
jgi:hypothetical protein